MENTNNINNTNIDDACSEAIKKERGLFFQRLTGELPSDFKFYLRLIGVADPISHDINCSINELAKVINYDCYKLWLILMGLSGLKFIELFPKPYDQDYDKEIRIKILVHY